jgi:cellulose synthase/poly-beta-1,6-N-acetylglucosamine synthase-like glycosyltransferase|tara:strand:- start:5 stop:562 length:558 start_codon:yes stop_codon:yes gene_type:complete
MEILSNLTPVEIAYFSISLIFILFFGINGIFKSLGFSLKIIGSISIPFLTYKKILSYISSTFNDNDFLSNLIFSQPLISEIIVFIIFFLISYFLLGTLVNALNVNLPKNLTFKFIDFITGSIYGIFIFSILFYFAYNLTLKNMININVNNIMLLNINIYENIRSENHIDLNNNESESIEENNEIY